MRVPRTKLHEGMNVALPAEQTQQEPVVLREDRDGVARLTLNRPEARNALSVEMLAGLQNELDNIAEDPSVRVVVIGATGPAFCAGHDMKQMRENPSESYYKALFARSSRLMLTIMGLPQPVVARIHATATAAGTQLVGSCDLAVAVEDAKFATPGVHIGLFCSTPMVALSRNIGRKQAMEMLLTGTPISARRAAELGLINKAVPADGLDAAVDAYCEILTQKSPLVLKIGKEAFYKQLESGVEEAYQFAAAVMARNMMAEDAAEGIDAFLAKREPSWKGR